MRHRSLLCAAILVAATLSAGRAAATLLALDATGSFGPTSTLGGIAFGADTTYSFRAIFDSMEDRNPNPGDGAGYFRVTQFTITIERHGSFEGTANDELNVALLDSTYHLGIHAAGLLTSRGEPFFLDSYSAVAPAFDPHAPTPVTFLGYLTTLSSLPYVIPLTGGAGGLAIFDVGDAARTASVVAIPEPPVLTLMGLGVLVLLVGSPSITPNRATTRRSRPRSTSIRPGSPSISGATSLR